MSFTYAQLKQAIQDYTDNAETTFVNNLPLFIRAAEERVLKDCAASVLPQKCHCGKRQATSTLPALQTFWPLTRLGYTKANGDKEFLLFKDVNFVQEFNPDAQIQVSLGTLHSLTSTTLF
jgi:hypothetical protein